MYPSTKGKAEDAVKALEFDRTSIYRPGLLLTDQRAQPRMFEGCAQGLARFMDKGQSMSITTEVLAKGMVMNAFKSGGTTSGSEILEHNDIVKLVQEDTK